MEANNQELKTNAELYTLLEDEKLQKCFNKSLADLEKCSECGSDEYVSKILIGKPSSQACDIAHITGFFKLGGCKMTIDRKFNYCRKCKKGF
jgi:hypothetical protein